MSKLSYTDEQKLIFDEIIQPTNPVLTIKATAGKFIASYSTIVEAAKSTGLTTNLVSKWMQGKSTVIKPTFIFERKEPEIE